MTTALNYYCVLFTSGLILISTIGCGPAVESVAETMYPVGRLIKSDVQTSLFSSDDLKIVVRNTGIEGQIFVGVYEVGDDDHSISQEWSRIEYFAAGEEREMTITLSRRNDRR